MTAKCSIVSKTFSLHMHFSLPILFTFRSNIILKCLRKEWTAVFSKFCRNVNLKSSVKHRFDCRSHYMTLASLDLI